MDYFQAAMVASYASHFRNLRRPGPEDEEDYYRRNDPQSFRPRPAMSIAVIVGLPLLVMLIAGA